MKLLHKSAENFSHGESVLLHRPSSTRRLVTRHNVRRLIVVAQTLVCLVQLFSFSTYAQTLGEDALSAGASFNEDLKKANDIYKKFKGAQSAAKVLQKCLDSGNSLEFCGIKTSLCFLYKKVTGKQRILKVIGVREFVNAVFNEYCLGEPTLKCCRSVGGGYCWSAFNDPRPINCEGNPHYGPTTTIGLCLRPLSTGVGCLCDYLAGCQLPESALSHSSLINSAPIKDYSKYKSFSISSPFEEYPEDEYHVGRMDSYINRVGYAVQQLFQNCSVVPLGISNDDEAIGEDTSACTDLYEFVRFRGCTDFGHNLNILQEMIPEEDPTPVDIWGNPISRPGDLVDRLPAMRQPFSYFAIARLALDIPQFWLRIDYIMGHILTEESRSKALQAHGILDPEKELLNYVDYGGIHLLKLSLLDDWPMILIPVNESLWTTLEPPSNLPSNETFHHCTAIQGRGEVPLLSNFSSSINVQGKVEVHLHLLHSYRSLVIRFYWDEFYLMDIMSILDGSLIIEKVHNYSSCGIKRIRIQITNESGLRTILHKSVDIPCVSNLTVPKVVDYPAIASVDVQIEVTNGGNQNGNAGNQFFLFDAIASSQERTLEELNNVNSSLYETMGASSTDDVNEAMMLTLTLPWNGHPLRYIRFTCRSINHYLYSYGLAKIVGVRVKTVGGDLINVTFTASPNIIYCARRGDVYEDEQEIAIIMLDSVQDGATSNRDMGLDNQFFDRDGFFYEKLPGRYTYQSEIIIPTRKPTNSQPTRELTRIPTYRPSKRPSKQPTRKPTRKITRNPTRRPTKKQTQRPSRKPSKKPTKWPTRKPTKRPTILLTRKPSKLSTRVPSRQPTQKQSKRPTRKPSRQPTKKPTRRPTKKPTRRPTKKPTRRPTKKPTRRPTKKPTRRPTKKPTRRPTKKPTRRPTKKPTQRPTSRLL